MPVQAKATESWWSQYEPERVLWAADPEDEIRRDDPQDLAIVYGRVSELDDRELWRRIASAFEDLYEQKQQAWDLHRAGREREALRAAEAAEALEVNLDCELQIALRRRYGQACFETAGHAEAPPSVMATTQRGRGHKRDRVTPGTVNGEE